jgi:hypothetical protein
MRVVIKVLWYVYHDVLVHFATVQMATVAAKVCHGVTLAENNSSTTRNDES